MSGDNGEAMQRKLQHEVDQMMSALDKDKLRPLQRNVYLKMAACLENTSASQEHVQHCLEQKQHLLQSAQGVVQNEMNRFQERLGRCAQSCQDEVQDQLTPNMDRSSPKFLQIEKKVNGCMAVCVDKHIALLRSTVNVKIRSDIDEIIKRM